MNSVDGRAGQWASGGLAVRIFLVMASGYFMSYGLRAINASIAPELVSSTGIDNRQLGALSSAYFLGFALMQLPLGIWLDRFGPRRVDAVLMAIAGVGCLGFALSTDFLSLWLSRMLIGVGMSAGLMACFATSRLWFAPHLQTRLAAWTMVVGVLGVLVTTIPVRFALTITDWRGIFIVCAAMLAVIATTMWFAVPRGRGETPTGKRESFFKSLVGYREVARSSYFWRMALTGAFCQGGFLALQTLWVGPWFNRVLGMSPAATGVALFVFNVTLLGGYLLVGWFAPRLGTSVLNIVRVATVAVVMSLTMFVIIALWPAFSGLWTWVALAFFSTVFSPIQASIGMRFRAEVSGRALTASNLLIFVSVFVIQTSLGFVLDQLIAWGYDEATAFRFGIGLIAALQLIPLYLLWSARRHDVVPAAPAGSGSAA